MAIFVILRASFAARRGALDVGPEDDLGPTELLLPEIPPARSAPERIDRFFDRLILETGLGINPLQALGFIVLGGAIGAATATLFRNDPLVTAFGLIIGMLVPFSYFTIQRYRYRLKIQDQLPDAVFLIARSLRAGQNLDQALATVARYGTPPLSREFHWVVEQSSLGLHVSTALQAMARRIRISDFNIFVTAISLYRTLGGNLAELLDRVAISIRDRNQFRGYFRAATALGRITGFAIALAPLIILVAYAIWQPDFITLLTSTPAGIKALSIAALLEIIGIIWLYLILRIEY
jgi:tight adherence protein B